MDDNNIVSVIESQVTCNGDTGDEIERKEDESLVQTRIVLIGDTAKDEEICKLAESFGLPVALSADGNEYLNDDSVDNIFVLNEFSGPFYDAVHHSDQRIIGPTTLRQCVEKGENLPNNARPLFSMAMSGLVICFTGFRKRDELTRMITLIHNMGGGIRREMNRKVTHLVANCCGGEKYRYATTFRLPIMSETWVYDCWEKRDDPSVYAGAEDVMQAHKLKPFHGSKVCFHGFSDQERDHMIEILRQNGGTEVDLEDPSCTHVVLDSGDTYDLLKARVVPFTPPSVCLMPNLTSPADSTCNTSILPRQSTPIEQSDIPIFASENDNIANKLGRLEDNDTGFVTPTKTCSLITSRISLPGPTFFSVKGRSHPVSDELPKFSSFLTPGNVNPKNKRNHDSQDLNNEISPGYKTPKLRRFSLANMSTRTPNRNKVVPLSTRMSPRKSRGSPRIKEEEQMLTSVIDESEVQNIPENAGPKCIIVKAEWFWASVQNEVCCDEKDYLFEDYLESLVSPGRKDSSGTPNTHSFRARKRKRLKERVSCLIPSESPSINKRRSSVSDAGLLSISGSFIDGTPTSPDGEVDEVETITTDSVGRKSLSARQQVFNELLQTEKNYVNILDTIMTLFKNPLEEMIEEGRDLLNVTELKIVFGNLTPIYEVHMKMLDVLEYTATHWKEDNCIGEIILKFAPDLVKAYPPFVNFFEETKDTLTKCDQTKPRFHAFLKIGQSKPECGRQTLQELLIRPVQRLPSISLLLNDILKHTQKSNPDHIALEKALSCIREVMTHINEDKRKTEGQMVMFDIFNGIDNCPPHLVSSHRSFVLRCDVIELNGDLSGRGDSLVFYLFTDMLEICKKRSKAFNSLKSPNAGSVHSVRQCNGKLFKHIQLIPLSNIKRVIDVRESDDFHNVFGIICRNQKDFSEKLVTFMIDDDETDKLAFLKTLCRQMANTVCKTDAENFLTPLDSKQAGLSNGDILGTLTKAFKFASQTRKKVGRAFSFNKTPNRVKRAVSNMVNPFGSTTSLTPSYQLSQMRLASCTDLSVAPVQEESYVAPMSVQPTRRKNKCSSMSVASLGRL